MRLIYDKIYHPCPMCRTGLELTEKEIQGEKWKMAVCQNCGSEVWVKAFAKRIKE